MAISLNDVRKSKKGHNQLKRVQKKRALRPWESFSTKKNPPSRGHVGYDAVMRARQIVERNNSMIEEIKKRGLRNQAPTTENSSLEDRYQQNDRFLIKEESTTNSYKIKNKKNFFGMIKDMLDN
ncbi:MAG: hypothetical protein OXB84_01965 [Halobacteriovoraceae bacterium]|nr:hypothetical protein [Halobacteriovoraceae bacterium]